MRDAPSSKTAQRSEQLLKRFDQNGDGKLDDDERADAKEMTLREQLDRQRARAAALPGGPTMANSMSPARRLGNVPMRSELLRRFDSNADGIVDGKEFVELERFVRPRMESNRDQLRRHDANRDGTLDEAEWVAARATIAQWLNAPGPAASENESLRPKRPVRPPRTSGKKGKMRGSEIETARLKAVADEVARRRAERAAAQKSNDSTP
jgi:hypothetical protein